MCLKQVYGTRSTLSRSSIQESNGTTSPLKQRIYIVGLDDSPTTERTPIAGFSEESCPLYTQPPHTWPAFFSGPSPNSERYCAASLVPSPKSAENCATSLDRLECLRPGALPNKLVQASSRLARIAPASQPSEDVAQFVGCQTLVYFGT